MNRVKRFFVTGALLVLVAGCVTINVYFPAAAAEKAADKVIDEVWGEGSGKAGDEPQSAMPAANRFAVLFGQSLTLLIPAAEAAADINVSSATANAIKARMRSRHSQLVPHYDSGAVGLTSSGLVTLRDPQKVPLKARRSIKQLVNAENSDRTALYREIAQLNGHPEWEAEIRSTFARRWVSRARSGWWYQNSSGGWQQR